jgi:hypothetical protein
MPVAHIWAPSVTRIPYEPFVLTLDLNYRNVSRWQLLPSLSNPTSDLYKSINHAVRGQIMFPFSVKTIRTNIRMKYPGLVFGKSSGWTRLGYWTSLLFIVLLSPDSSLKQITTTIIYIILKSHYRSEIHGITESTKYNTVSKKYIYMYKLQ